MCIAQNSNPSRLQAAAPQTSPTVAAFSPAAGSSAVDDIAQLLASLGLSAFAPAFREEEITPALLLRLKESQLEKLIPKVDFLLNALLFTRLVLRWVRAQC